MSPLAFSAVFFGFCVVGVGLTATWLRVRQLEASLNEIEKDNDPRWVRATAEEVEEARQVREFRIRGRICNSPKASQR